ARDATSRASAVPRRVRFPGPACERGARACRTGRMVDRSAAARRARAGPARVADIADCIRGRAQRKTQASATSAQARRRKPLDGQRHGATVTPAVAYVGLGSNLDEPARRIALALTELEGIPATRLLRHSRLYRSA